MKKDDEIDTYDLLAESLMYTASVFLIFELALTIIFEIYGEKLTYFFLTMQLMKSITIYNVRLPAHIQIIINHIGRFIDGEPL